MLQRGGDYGASGGYDYDHGGHTGDPRLDLEYERDNRYGSGSSYIVPEPIKLFLTEFYTAITEQNLYEIQNLYDNGSVNIAMLSDCDLSLLAIVVTSQIHEYLKSRKLILL